MIWTLTSRKVLSQMALSMHLSRSQGGDDSGGLWFIQGEIGTLREVIHVFVFLVKLVVIQELHVSV